MENWNLALERTGYPTLADFQRAEGLPPTGKRDAETEAALLPWLLGIVRHRVEEGDTYYNLAQRYGTTVRRILAANPGQDPNRLAIGQLLTIPLGFPLVPADRPLSAGLARLCLQGIAARYPFVETETIAVTETGRPVQAAALGKGRRTALYNGAHHANEWMTALILLKFLEEYAQAVVDDGTLSGFRARELFDSTRLYLAPMVNPDGVDLVTGRCSRAEYRRAAAMAAQYPDIPFPAGWKANLAGVDLNLQYPAGWERARERKFADGYTRPGPRDYVGGAPLEQPEAAGLYGLTQRIRPGLTLSYHTQGRVIYWQYGGAAPEGAEERARWFSEISGYTPEPTPPESDNAGYKDWFIDAFGRPGYTIEAGLGENPLPLSDFGRIYGENLGILTLGLAELRVLANI